MRDDLTNKLVHLTKGIGEDPSKHRAEALKNFASILAEQKIIGGTGYIKGSHTCVCFSETPVSKLSHLFSDDSRDFKYQPYGIMFNKEYIYKLGGRPAIYGPDSDYQNLPDSQKYRHVRFELGLGQFNVDHTWEREWRLKVQELTFTPADVTLIVANRSVIEDIKNLNPKIIQDWHFLALADIGIDISTL
ncbi:hypothetical protein ACU5EH_05485 [Aliivibrio salmonicida]|uniref:hypothetical protein n=1 Tax=Aliivibrio salmonicida TaxID=40269 RepID=UPI00406D321A